MQITSPSFKEGESIPAKHTCDGIDLSPELNWQDAPEKTKSFVVICDDPDAPAGTWVHWIIFNISADRNNLPNALPTTKVVLGGAKQGTNDFGNIGWGGPCPPGKSVHRYFFLLFALDTELNLDSGVSRDKLEKTMKGHILEQAVLMGTYGS